ncbi:serine/threonine-protein phosphatase 4 regulatory subunit 2-B-like [Haliotis asinina]|uniref:serine/threonine-protein phosphatase 4 regulatory subunit 2-B-like n=1 Tax=Haliotis asinina TaxID=109174 RepID=UPI0035321D14
MVRVAGEEVTMDNREEVFDALNDFEKKPSKNIPPLLEQFLSEVAKTGETLFPWPRLKPLLVSKLDQVMTEFHQEIPVDHFPPNTNMEQVKFDDMRDRIIKAVERFHGAPFTIQRLCELITDPKRHYKRSDKFLRGIEKNVLVVSTVDPFGRKVVSEPRTLVNGLDSNGCTQTGNSLPPPPVPSWPLNSQGLATVWPKSKSDSEESAPSPIEQGDLSGVDQHQPEAPLAEKYSPPSQSQPDESFQGDNGSEAASMDTIKRDGSTKSDSESMAAESGEATPAEMPENGDVPPVSGNEAAVSGNEAAVLETEAVSENEAVSETKTGVSDSEAAVSESGTAVSEAPVLGSEVAMSDSEAAVSESEAAEEAPVKGEDSDIKKDPSQSPESTPEQTPDNGAPESAPSPTGNGEQVSSSQEHPPVSLENQHISASLTGPVCEEGVASSSEDPTNRLCESFTKQTQDCVSSEPASSTDPVSDSMCAEHPPEEECASSSPSSCEKSDPVDSSEQNMDTDSENCRTSEQTDTQSEQQQSKEVQQDTQTDTDSQKEEPMDQD